jgi:hypothetical protein
MSLAGICVPRSRSRGVPSGEHDRDVEVAFLAKSDTVLRKLEKSPMTGRCPGPNLRLTCGKVDPQHSFWLLSRTRRVAAQRVSWEGRR